MSHQNPLITSIGFDVDGTLFDILTPTLEEFNLRHNTDFRTKDITDYKVHKILGITQREFLDLLDHVWINNYDEIKPYELDTYLQIQRLRDNGLNVLIVTRRDFGTIFSVINVLKRWKIAVDGFICLNNTLNKTLVNIDVMIDDSKEIIDSFGDKGYLVKRGYNHIYDVESIKDFVNKIISGEIPNRKAKYIVNLT